MKKLVVSAVIIGVFMIYTLTHARASVGFAPSQGSTTDPSSGSGSSGSSGSTTQNGGTPAAGSHWQAPQWAGRCLSTASGVATSDTRMPGCPSWPPHFLPLFSRRLLGVRRSPSLEGGLQKWG
jgi:hypothetical protein